MTWVWMDKVFMSSSCELYINHAGMVLVREVYGIWWFGLWGAFLGAVLLYHIVVWRVVFARSEIFVV